LATDTTTGTASAAVPTLITSVQRALRLLEAAASHPGGAPAKQLAREAGIPLPTAYHLLRTLTHEHYLRREKGVFMVGEAARRLASDGGGGNPDLVVQNRRTRVREALEHWRDTLGVPVYCARYTEGEIEVLDVADTEYAPAVEEWADFRETAHAHAIGQCLLGQLGEAERRDHLGRHPVQPVTAHSVRDRRALLERLTAGSRTAPYIERQEYELGTVCAAIPVSVGGGPAALAISLPLHQQERLLPAIEQLRRGTGGMPVGPRGLADALELSISI
jgi:DNA-binding IclR family transcriptional regulator